MPDSEIPAAPKASGRLSERRRGRPGAPRWLRRWRARRRRKTALRPWRQRLVPTTGTVVALSLLLAAFSMRIADPAWMESARVRTFDLYQRLAPRTTQVQPVVIVDIDEKSLSAVGQWPWPR
jgi:CHASE2 domain-containing sensor protein